MEYPEQRRIEEKVWNSLSLAKRVFSELRRVKSVLECWLEVEGRVDKLSLMMKTLLRFITAASAQKFLRPVDCIIEEVEGTLKHALDVASKFNQRSIIPWFFNITKITDFQALIHSLDDSIGNVKWLIIVYDPINNGGFEGIVGFLPPIAISNPSLLLVWSCIATVKMGRRSSDRIDAIKTLALLAQDSRLYKKYIVKEGGAPLLLKLLQETASASFEAQMAATNALCALTNAPEIIKRIEIVMARLLKDAPTEEAQILAVNLVIRMADPDMTTEYDSAADESLILRLVTLLSSANVEPEINSWKRKLKIRCAKALWMLAARSISNCRTITKTKAMLCLAKLVEKEGGKLKYYCLMTITQITAAAESDIHFRLVVFKTNTPSSKAVVEQLVRVIEESKEPKMQIPAIRSIGSLARIFGSRDNRVIGPLVSLLNDMHLTVATEAAIALQKFTSPENHLCIEHWKSVLGFISYPALTRLIEGGNRLQRQRWVLNINKHAKKCLMRSISLSPLMTFIGVDNMILGYYSPSNESAHNPTDPSPVFSPQSNNQEPCFMLCPVKC